MSVSEFLREQGKSTRRFVGAFGGGTREITYNDLSPRDKDAYDRWYVNKQENPSHLDNLRNNNGQWWRGKNQNTNTAQSQSTVNIPKPDLSFKAFLKEKGYKDYVRTGLFQRKRTKTYDRASKKEKREYTEWKSQKQSEYEARVRDAEINQMQGVDSSLTSAEIIKRTGPSQRELDNQRFLESIERIEAVDLSLDLGNYLGDVTLEERYPGLVESITEQVFAYGNEFRDEEQYAEVIVTDTINNALEVAEHINWMITPPNSTLDVEIRDVESFSNFVLQTTENVGLGLDVNGNKNLEVKDIEKPKSKPPKIQPRKISSPREQIKRDAKVIDRTKPLPFDIRKTNRQPFSFVDLRNIQL